MPNWTPANISTALWFDAADAATLFNATSGGTAVAADGEVWRWEDKSGNGRHAIQGGATLRPVRKVGVRNSLDAIRFDGSNDGLTHSLTSGTTTLTLIACYKLNSLQSGYRGVVSAGSSGRMARCYWQEYQVHRSGAVMVLAT